MNAYKVELLIIDFENIGEHAIRGILYNAKFPNDCIRPEIMKIISKDIGEWTDNHPLNSYVTMDDEYNKIFE